MDTMTLGVVGAAVLGLMWVKSNREKTDNKVDVGKGETPPEGYPEIPVLKTDAKMDLAVYMVMLSEPGKWSMANWNGPANEANYLAIFAGQTWLYDDAFKAQYLALASFLKSRGVAQAEQIAQERIDGEAIGECTIEFDVGLPALQRDIALYMLSAQKWEDLDKYLDDNFGKYPLFKASIKKFATGKAVRPIGKTEGKKSPVDSIEPEVDHEHPDTWGLPDTFGPESVPTPHGPLYVPSGGSILDGLPYYTVQEGDFSGAKIAEHWGKGPEWVKAIVAANPSHVFGGAKNTVYVGTKLKMPVGFLDPKASAPSVTPGSKDGQVSPGDTPPAGAPKKPTADPGEGQQWVYVKSVGKWVSLPVDGPDYPNADPGPGRHWQYDPVKKDWVSAPDEQVNPYANPDAYTPEDLRDNVAHQRQRLSLSHQESELVMACCASCAKGGPCGADRVGYAIAIRGGIPLYVGTTCTPLNLLLPEGSHVTAGQVHEYLLASYPGTHFPAHLSAIVGSLALRFAQRLPSSFNFGPVILGVVASWRRYGNSGCGADPYVTQYLLWLRKYARRDPVAIVVVDFLRALSTSIKGSWLRLSIDYICEPERRMRRHLSGAKIAGFCYPHLGECYR